MKNYPLPYAHPWDSLTYSHSDRRRMGDMTVSSLPLPGPGFDSFGEREGDLGVSMEVRDGRGGREGMDFRWQEQEVLEQRPWISSSDRQLLGKRWA